MPSSARRPTAAQNRVFQHIVRKCGAWIAQVRAMEGPVRSGIETWNDIQKSATSATLRLSADAVDLPDAAATCDPASLLGPDLRRALQSSTAIVPGVRIGHSTHVIPAHSRREYAKLIARELALGKVTLRRDADGIGSIFCSPSPMIGNERYGMARLSQKLRHRPHDPDVWETHLLH